MQVSKLSRVRGNSGDTPGDTHTLGKVSAAEREEAQKEKGICFGCLCIGHMSKDCDKRLTCKFCGQNHPSVPHITKKSRASTDIEQSKDTSRGTPASLQICGLTGAGKDDCIQSILLVQVKSIKGDKIQQTCISGSWQFGQGLARNISCKS